MENHFIIGLGGTGGKIIRSFRKSLHAETRDLNPKNITFLHVDTSDDLMRGGEAWKILGKSVELPQGNKLLLSSPDLKDLLVNIENYPNLKAWIGNKSVIQNFASNSAAFKIEAAQRRKIGRLRIATNITTFNNKIFELSKRLRDNTKENKINFHICCGISGGTGSGIIVDVISQIRKHIGVRDGEIILYLLLAEEGSTTWNSGGFYYANTYATLKELNALSIGKYKPIDVDPKFKGRRLDNLDDFFKCAYIIENVNSNNTTLNIENEIPDLIGNFLFSKIAVGSNVDFKTDVLDRQENFTNVEPNPEEENEDIYDKINGTDRDKKARSVKFLRFGIKKLEVPKEEIYDFIVYNNLNSLLNSCLYYNWHPKEGFVNEPKNIPINELLSQQIENFKISDDYFTLNKRIIASSNTTEKYITIKEFWEIVIPRCETRALKSNNDNWLSEMLECSNSQFHKLFRNVGVKEFYNNAQRDISDLSNELIINIKNELFRKWRQKEISLFDIQRFTRNIKEDIEKRRNNIAGKKTLNRNTIETADLNINKAFTKWRNIGILAEKLLNRKERILAEFSQFVKVKFIAESENIALDFASELMIKTIDALGEFENSLNDFISKFRSKSDEISNILNQQNIREESIAYNDDKVLSSKIIRFYDPKKIRDLNKVLLTDKEFQNSIYDTLYNDVVNYDNEKNKDLFTQFNDKELNHIIENIGDKIKLFWENYLNAKDLKYRISGIYEELGSKFNNNDESLNKFTKRILELSGEFLRFDLNSSLNLDKEMISTTTIIIPEINPNDIFQSKLKKSFADNSSSSIFIEKSVEHNNSIEIISITNLFPLRTIGHLKKLKEEYDNLTLEDKAYIHTEDICFNEIPEIVVKTPEELKIELSNFQNTLEVTETLILGYIFDLIKKDEDKNGKIQYVVYSRNTETVATVKSILGSSLKENPNYIYKDTFDFINKEIELEFKNKNLKDEIKIKLLNFREELENEKDKDREFINRNSEAINNIIKKLEL
jgi:hypothetical protein